MEEEQILLNILSFTLWWVQNLLFFSVTYNPFPCLLE